MTLPFSVADFLDVFGRYNQTIWPVQFVLVVIAAAMIVLSVLETIHSHHSSGSRWIGGLLAALWLWMGFVYHWTYFSTINPAAYVFGGLFVIQAGVLLWLGAWHSRIRFRFRLDTFGIAGVILIIYALFIYPALGYLTGHIYPRNATFGLPCPTTIFTLGLFLWIDRPVPLGIFVIPLIWTAIGSSAAVWLTMTEDYGLAAAGVTSIALTTWKNRHPDPTASYRGASPYDFH